MVARYRCLWIVLVLALSYYACRERVSGPPYSPAEALKMFRIEEGYRIEPFILEPHVISPVAMEFDENGRIFVVENPGYPLNTEGKIGRVKLLQDSTGDGQPDRVTTFAAGLVLPTGVMRWKKGILVTDAPHVWYFEDSNNDGQADIRRVVLTGFALTNPQHTVNSPVYGLDNWIYLAHENPSLPIIFKDKFGDKGTGIRFPDRSTIAPLNPRGRNIRFRPAQYQIEALSGTSQFGQAFDDWGQHFTLNNTYHARHEAIAARYLQRNPDLPVGNALQEMSDHGVPAHVFPIAARQRFEMLTNVGEFTSACGLTLFRGSAFVAEPAHNLVHRDVFHHAGSTFKASRGRASVEFLASTDPWFRPVNFTVGPDGALYMLDYYRLVIEHPEWMATRTHQSPELTQGSDRGRIYRILPPSGLTAPHPQGVRLGAAPDRDLVAHLENPNPWWRRTAQRLLVDRAAFGAVPDLARMALESRSDIGRLHALWTLEGIGKLETELIQHALRDPHPGVRRNAIILAESRLAASPTLASRLMAMADDPDTKVRFQLLSALGFLDSPPARAARERLLFRDVEDKWFHVAALSASSPEAPRLFSKAVSGAPETNGRTELLRLICAVIGARAKAAEVERVLATASHASADWPRQASLEGLAQGLRGKPRLAGRSAGLALKMFDSRSPSIRRAALRLLELTGLPSGPAGSAALSRARETAGSRNADPDARADSIGLLAMASQESAGFEALVDTGEPEQVQVAAVRALGRIKGDRVGAFLLKNWRNLTAPVRAEAADAMYLEPSRVWMLVNALQKGEVQPWTLAFRHKRRLIMHDDPAIRGTSRPLLEESAGHREAVLKRYEPALDRSADAARGRQVFESVCSKCHRLGGKGTQVGPDLDTVRSQPKQALLSEILMPSRSISQGYESYVVQTTNSGTLEGVLGSQTAAAIVLRHEDGKEDIVQRKDIQSMYATDLSAMPGDLEKQIDPQQMADLLEFLKSENQSKP